MKKLEITIDKIVPEGVGLGKVDGKVVFVEGVIPEERVVIEIISEKKDYMVGKVLEIKEPSKDRLKPRCKYEREGCGGCQWQFIDYKRQVKLKEEIVKEAFSSIARIETLPLKECIGMSSPWKYRTRMYLPIQKREDGKIILGYYKRRTHEIVDIDSCIVSISQLSGLIVPIKKYLQKKDFSIYDEKSHSGKLRHLILIGSEKTKETVVGFVSRKFYLNRNIGRSILRFSPSIVGVVENENRTKGNVIFGEKFRLLSGRDFYNHTVLDTTMTVTLGTFFQVNHKATDILLKVIEQFLKDKEFDKAVDLYGGSGLFSTLLVNHSNKVIIVENNPRSILDAKRWIKRKGVKEKVEIIADDVEKVVNSLEGYQLMVIDPPRKGASHEVFTAISNAKPKYIIYVSCNPPTLARDTKLLLELGYDLLEIVPIDMFPHTYHIETVSFFQRK